MKLKRKPQVNATPAVADAKSIDFFAAKLRGETDPADVWYDMQHDIADFILLDVRSEEDYAAKHAAGAISLPHSRITEKRMSDYHEDTLFIVYCWGPGCNGSTKAALKLSKLGFAVKEMIGGIEYWEREGNPVRNGSASAS